ncbi:putative structural protein [Tsukamurella phage TIN4]|uniref:Capsid decoration protein n=2 Tax=Tinduovirus TIN3 TaxID=1982571 RepID=A0A0K0N5L6_9CAUD|nr:head decoration [Tsukamurella phage TIN3]YP_009604137.1 head decoration [Tsukamurella phage TIN4]AKJ71804.1 hypothetical protein TIN3_7 [Tsukamurella phage TIN3]AKJ71913.1 putative structural protein [Tsukamurella phage TIN4]
MADFVSGREDYAVHGKRNILRSAQPGSYTVVSKTVSSAAFPVEKIDGFDQKVLQEGDVLVALTTGPNAGKVVPFQVGVAEDLATLVGVTKDYFGWELNERDVEAGVLVRGQLVQAWCSIRDADGNRVAVTNAVADALRGKKNLDILFF